MTVTLTINDIAIPSSDVTKWPNNKECLEFDNRLLPEKISLTLDNTDIDSYDDRQAGSLFYGADFYNWIVKLYDSAVERDVFTGNLKNISITDGDGTLEIEVGSIIEDLSKKKCVYTNASNKTPAEIIYELLTGSANGNIAAASIIYGGFQNAINIQDANSVYVNVAYTLADNKYIMNVINELLRITQCHLYTYQNLIYMYQWQAYAGALGIIVNEHQVLSGTYKHYYSEEKIKNSYSIAYDNAGSVLYATGSDATSVAKYGDKAFTVPDENVESTTSTDFKVLFRNGTGAAWAGALAIQRRAQLKKYYEMKLPYDWCDIKLTDQIDLTFDPFVREPSYIVEREINLDDGTLNLKGEFLNTPYTYAVVDIEPPDPPELIAAIPVSTTKIILKWTVCTASDYAGYKIYFTSSGGEWYSEICNYGMSPVDNKTTDTTVDGYAFCYIGQLTPGAEYYFKVTAYDTSYNESDFSNIVTCRTYATAVNDNMYCCQGNIVEDYLWLDMNNTMGGTVPSGFVTYDDINYDTGTYGPTAFYESGIYYNDDGWTDISWRGAGDADDIKYQIRTSDDNSTWSSWSAAADAIGTKQYNFSGEKYFQIRFIFYSPLWSDLDWVYIIDVN